MLGKAKPAAVSQSNSSLTDPDFGDIRIRRLSGARYIRLRLLPDGTLRATMPKRAPLRLLIKLLDDSRANLKLEAGKLRLKQNIYLDGLTVGHSHKLTVEAGRGPKGKLSGQEIRITLPADWPPNSLQAQSLIRKYVKNALDKEARSYLPRRVKYLADELGYGYVKLRFGNPKGRWGSYSSAGTISLNVALMTLPLELIDYVLIHELCHSRYAHHQTEFWQEVEKHQPDYRQLRKRLKDFSPYL